MVIEHRPVKSDSEQELHYDESARPIWEVVAEIGRQIPDEEWGQIPQDASVNYREIHTQV